MGFSRATEYPKSRPHGRYGAVFESPSPTGRGYREAAGEDVQALQIPHPALRATFSRWEKDSRKDCRDWGRLRTRNRESTSEETALQIASGRYGCLRSLNAPRRVD